MILALRTGCSEAIAASREAVGESPLLRSQANKSAAQEKDGAKELTQGIPSKQLSLRSSLASHEAALVSRGAGAALQCKRLSHYQARNPILRSDQELPEGLGFRRRVVAVQYFFH